MRDANWSLDKLAATSSKLLDNHDKKIFRERKDWDNMNSSEKIHYGGITSPKQDPSKEDAHQKEIDDLRASLAAANKRIAELEAKLADVNNQMKQELDRVNSAHNEALAKSTAQIKQL